MEFLLQDAGIKKTDSGIESHNALGVGGKYHDFLKSIYRKVRAEHPTIHKKQVLSLAVHAMNNTAGHNGLSPTLLVFGIVPRNPVKPMELPAMNQRLIAMQKARREMVKLLAQSRLRTARRINVPSATDRDICPGMDVLFYREKPIYQWTGLFKVLAVHGKQVWLHRNGNNSLASIDKVKELQEKRNEEGVSQQQRSSQDQPSPSKIKPIGYVLDSIIVGETFLTKQKKEFTDLAEEKDEKTAPYLDSDKHATLHLREILNPGDPPTQSAIFSKAKALEIEGLLQKDAFRKVKLSKIPRKTNTLGGRFFCTPKNINTEKEQPKARYVAQGHTDKDKLFIVHRISTLRQSSTKIILSTAAVLGFRVF